LFARIASSVFRSYGRGVLLLEFVPEAGQGILTAGLSFFPPIMCTDRLPLASNVISRDDQAGHGIALVVPEAENVPGTVDSLPTN